MTKTGLFERAWPQFRALIETPWKAFVDDRVGSAEAIKQVVAGLE